MKKRRHKNKNGKLIPSSQDKSNGRHNDPYPEWLKEEAKKQFLVGKTYEEIRDSLRPLWDKIPSITALSRWRHKHDWDKEKRKFDVNVRTLTLDKIADTEAQTRARLYGLFDELELRVWRKLWKESPGKNKVRRWDIDLKDLKQMTEIVHKISQNKLLLNTSTKVEDLEEVEYSLKDIQSEYNERTKEKESEGLRDITFDPESGFVPPSEMIEKSKSGFDDLV